MKTIATVNCILPTVEDSIDYASGQSLSDFDIVLFNPKFPCQDRVFFSGGGSCVSIEGAKKLKNSMSHWAKELGEAIRAGKTVFFLLNEYENDIGASGVNIGTRNTRNYSTFSINNYEVLPVRFGVRNAKGKYFKGLLRFEWVNHRG